MSAEDLIEVCLRFGRILSQVGPELLLVFGPGLALVAASRIPIDIIDGLQKPFPEGVTLLKKQLVRYISLHRKDKGATKHQTFKTELNDFSKNYTKQL